MTTTMTITVTDFKHIPAEVLAMIKDIAKTHGLTEWKEIWLEDTSVRETFLVGLDREMQDVFVHVKALYEPEQQILKIFMTLENGVGGGIRWGTSLFQNFLFSADSEIEALKQVRWFMVVLSEAWVEATHWHNLTRIIEDAVQEQADRNRLKEK